MRRIDGVVQLVLFVGLIAGIVWGCQPADSGVLYRQCEQHLKLCRRCRDMGQTPGRMLARATPTTCLSFGAIPGPEGQACAYQFSPANSGQ
jgi:hypothetical protein